MFTTAACSYRRCPAGQLIGGSPRSSNGSPRAKHVGEDDGVGDPIGERKHLAYRLLGSLAEAEDVVQETYARWYAMSRQQQDAIESPATATADSGGLVSAELRPVEGAEQIARYMADLARREPGLTLLERTVNGQPGLVAQQGGITVTVFAFDIAGEKIKHIWAIRNPDKLRPWTTD